MSDSLQEEIEVLKSIYLDELIIEPLENLTRLSIRLYSGQEQRQLLISLLVVIDVSANYPGEVPIVSLKNPRGLEESFVQSLETKLDQLIADKQGCPVLFDLINHVQEVIGELKAPQLSCSICLWYFHPEDQIFKTDCDHFFHKICFFHYATHQIDLQSESNQSEQTVICPICRNSVGSDSWSGFVDATAPILDTDLSEELIVPYNAAKWAEIYERQQKNGGIIDRNAEANKFLVDENTTVTFSTTVPQVETNSAPGKEEQDDLDSNCMSEQPGSSKTIVKQTAAPSRNRRHWRGQNYTSNRQQYHNRNYGYGENRRQYHNYSRDPERDHHLPVPTSKRTSSRELPNVNDSTTSK